MRIRQFPTAWLPIALLLLAWATWSPALRNGFLADDLAGGGPLASLSYRIELLLHGPDPRGFHALQLALHAATAAMLFLLLRRFRVPWLASGLSAAIFAIHPALAPAVAWLGGRGEVLATLLVLATLWADLGRKNLGHRALSLLGLAAALLCKETAVVTPLLAALFGSAGERHETPPGRRELLRLLARRAARRWDMLVVIAVYGSARLAGALPAFPPVPDGPAGITRVMAIPHLPALLAAPWLSRIEYAPTLRPFVVLPGFLLGAGILGLLWLLSRSHVRPTRWERVPSVRRALLLSGIVAYIPSAWIIATTGAAAEGMLYLPATFMVPAAVLALARHMRRRGFLFVGGALLVLSIPVAATRATWWRSDATLLERAAAQPSPGAAVLVRLGALRCDAGDIEEAHRLLRKAQKTERTAAGHALLGRLYLAMGWDNAAAREYRGAVAIDRSDSTSAARLSALRKAQVEGRASGDDTIHPVEFSDEAYLRQRAFLMLDQGDLDTAWLLFHAAERLSPRIAEADAAGARLLLGRVLVKDPRNEEAARLLEQIEASDHAAQ